MTCRWGKCKEFSKWSYCNERPAQVKKCQDFARWSHCNGWSCQVKKKISRSFQWWKIWKFFKTPFLTSPTYPLKQVSLYKTYNSTNMTFV